MLIVFRKVEVCAAALRAVHNAPHGLFVAALRLGVILLRHGFQQIPHIHLIGRAGVRGKGIKNVRALYAVHNHPKEAPEDSKFSTELPDVVGQDKYLWTKVEVTVDGPNGGTVYAFPFVSKTGDKGEKGDTGAPAGFGTISAEVGSNVGSNANGSKPTVEVTADGDNTAKKLHFNFDYLRGATFTPRIEGGVLRWSCDNTALATPAEFDVVGGVQAAMGGYTIRKSSTAPAAGTSDNIITLVTEG